MGICREGRACSSDPCLETIIKIWSLGIVLQPPLKNMYHVCTYDVIVDHLLCWGCLSCLLASERIAAVYSLEGPLSRGGEEGGVGARERGRGMYSRGDMHSISCMAVVV